MSLDYQYSHHDRFLPAALEDRLIGLLARVAGLCLLGAIAVLWLSILTWSSSDPSLMHATGGNINNALGYFGATVSDLMLQTFGIATPLIMLAPMFWGIELLIAGRINAFGSRATYFPLAILILAGAFSALPVIDGWPLHHGFGGILGDAIYRLGSSLIAIVAPQRAGALTGLSFFALGFASVTYSLGLELKDIAAIIKSQAVRAASTTIRREPILSNLPRPNLSMARTHARNWGESLKTFSLTRANPVYETAPADDTRDPYESDEYQNYDYVSDTLDPNPNTGLTKQTQFPFPPSASRKPETTDQYTQQHHARFQPHVPAQDRNSLPQAINAAIGSFGLAATMTTPRFERPQPINRGEDFDGLTDASSRSIAERFAPANSPLAAKNHAKPAPAEKPIGQNQDDQTAIKNQTVSNNSPAPSRQSILKGQPLLKGMTFNAGPKRYQRPSLNLLDRPKGKIPSAHLTKNVLHGNAKLLEEVLNDFGVKGVIRTIKPGPVVTQFELEPARGTKSSRVIGLADDIARSMSAKSARIAVIEGRNAIGIELPNARRESVLLREILDSETSRNFKGTLPLTLGKSITGEPVIADLARMPHLLIAGTTGSGKSVGVNAMIVSLLYRFAPDQCRMLMIDPKMLELSIYNGIPHLMTPVVTDPHQAVTALNWVVGEMEERYKRMSKMSVRNIDIYNNRVRNAKKRGDMIARTIQTGFDQRTGMAVFEQQQMDMKTMPYIVVVIDEFADLMIAAGKEVEAAVQRLAQMARAAGIHLIMATQRPSVDVITGTIKANFPSRISFKVASKVDSRTILNEQGAEQLLGQGDMLFSTGAGNAQRVHGPFVSDEEVENIVGFLRSQNEPRYIDGITDIKSTLDEPGLGRNATQNGSTKGRDTNALYKSAVELVRRDGKASTSYLQRRLSIGYNRAADLIERMESECIIGPAGPTGKREVIANHTDGQKPSKNPPSAR